MTVNIAMQSENSESLDDYQCELYEPTGVFIEALYEFASRIQSLARFWDYQKTFLSKYCKANPEPTQADVDDIYKQSPECDGVFGLGELKMIHAETIGVDTDYFPEYIRGSIIACAFSLFESLINGVAEEVAKDLGTPIKLDARAMPYIERYILWLSRNAGLQISIDKSTRRNLDAFRAIRNKFIHQMDRSLPDDILRTLEEYANSILEEGFKLNDAYVDGTLRTICELAESIDKAYNIFWDSRNTTEPKQVSLSISAQDCLP